MAANGLQKALHNVRNWERVRVHASTIPKPLTASEHRLRSLQDRLAGWITDFAGSMRFVYLHTIWFGAWVAINGGLLVAMGVGLLPFDPFPFGFLTLVVSLEAIFLSTFVMIAQNRQSALADKRAQADYEVNVRAEAEVAKLTHLLEALLEHHVEAHEPDTEVRG
jgi:uncharacterized membrane protein